MTDALLGRPSGRLPLFLNSTVQQRSTPKPTAAVAGQQPNDNAGSRDSGDAHASRRHYNKHDSHNGEDLFTGRYRDHDSGYGPHQTPAETPLPGVQLEQQVFNSFGLEVTGDLANATGYVEQGEMTSLSKYACQSAPSCNSTHHRPKTMFA